MKVIDISASRINTFKQCAKRFEYEYVLEEPKLDNLYAIFGTALHESIEYKLKTGKPNLIYFNKRFEQLYEQAVRDGVTSGMNEYNRMVSSGNAMLKLMDYSGGYVDLELEFELPLQLDDETTVIIRGRIDRTTEGGDVIDHKSSKYKPNPKLLAYDPQMLIYYWAYKQLKGVYPKNVYINHLRTGELIRADVDIDFEYKWSRLLEDVKVMVNAHKSGYVRRTADNLCEYCPFFNKCFNGGDKNDTLHE